MNIFISQPMTGYTQKQILSERSKAINYIQNNCDDVQFINSYLPEFQDTDNPIYALGETIKLLSKADMIVFLKNWEQSKGCQIEHKICELYKIKKIYLIN